MINLFNYNVYQCTDRCEFSNNKDPRHVAPLKSAERRTVSGFQAGKRKISAQGRESTIESALELDSHADTIVCGSNCVIMHFTGKECDVSPYTEA
jgi:hypothetical protein